MNSVPRILWQNSDLAVLNKPTRMHSLRGKSKPNLQDWVETQFPSNQNLPDSGLLQRLDFETSGCILLSKNKIAYENWKQKLREHQQIQKIYLALSSVSIETQNFEFYFHSRYRSSKKVQVKNQGKLNEKGCGRIQSLGKVGTYSLYQVELIGAGKRHQIRASMARLGAPLVGDSLYGGPHAEFFGLHSWKLKCDLFSVICPLPTPWPKVEQVLNV